MADTISSHHHHNVLETNEQTKTNRQTEGRCHHVEPPLRGRGLPGIKFIAHNFSCMLNAVLPFFDISDTVGWASEWESGLLEYRSSNLLKVFLYILGGSLANPDKPGNWQIKWFCVSVCLHETIKEVWVLVVGFFVFLSARTPLCRSTRLGSPQY